MYDKNKYLSYRQTFFFLLFFCVLSFLQSSHLALWASTTILFRLLFIFPLFYSLTFLIFCCNFSRQFFFLFMLFFFHLVLFLFICQFFFPSKSSSITSFFCTAPAGGRDPSLCENYPSIDFCDYFFLSFHSLNFRWK